MSDNQQPALDVAAWRRARRKELIAQRQAIDPTLRARWDEVLEGHLQALFDGFSPGVVSFYWPFGGEFDARKLMARLGDQGWVLSLPVILERNTPMIFHSWTPDCPMVPGKIWGIPVPAGGTLVEPDIVLAPLVGFDAAKFRLGQGGGYFDRTLGGMARRPIAIGVGYELGAMHTIHPQPFDVPMDVIVTNAGVRR